MLDIVAPHQHQLPLPVEAEGVDEAEAGLAGPRAARQAQPVREQGAIDDEQRQQRESHEGADHDELHDGLVRQRQRAQK